MTASDDTQVLLTKAQGLRVVFPECERALEVRRLLTDDERRRLGKNLGRELEEKGFLVYLGLRGERLDGLAVITNEIGKTEPITFIVGANVDGTVRRVAVMVYRETHGGEVAARRFLAQFERKSLADPVELHRDVINVSGATLSATALCSGTRKVLAALDLLCLHTPAAELVAAARSGGAREIALRGADEHDPGPPNDGSPYLLEARRLVMGSELRVVAFTKSPGDAEPVQRALDAADRIDAALSDWRDDSELARVNRAAARGPVAVGETMLDFLVRSDELWRATRGAFDPAIGELVHAWGFRGGEPRRPDERELAALVAEGGFAGVTIDETTRTVAFTRPRVRLDPGAIGKGLAVDAVAAALRASGVTNALVDFGSTQLGLGTGEDGRGWPVAIRSPFNDGDAAADAMVEVIFLRDVACSTSGGYEKFIELGGRRLPHVLDPRSGHPAEQCASATVIASTGARADALSTALFVLGPEEGAATIDAIADAAGLIVPLARSAAAAPTRTSRWPR